ncbi:MAG: ABC transporter ATP-binding protein [Erysipelotrichaceae bacterium]
MNTGIEVNNLSKSFKNRKAVDNLSLKVHKGEVFGLLGHNGAGKSTTIDLILGLKKADEGHTEILGLEPSKYRKEIFEKVGVQLQSSSYQNQIKVNELCIQMSYLCKNPQDYHKLLHLFKLESLEKTEVNKLSGGEKQKLSIVLALINNPEIIFLDELTTGLDAAARRDIRKYLKELKSKGTTIFLTTHYMEEAEILCDRIFIIKEGKKIIEGTVEEIIKQSPYDNLEEAYLYYMEDYHE